MAAYKVGYFVGSLYSADYDADYPPVARALNYLTELHAFTVRVLMVLPRET